MRAARPDRTVATTRDFPRTGGRLEAYESGRGRRTAPRAERGAGADRVGARRGSRGARHVRGHRRAGRNRQDGAARGGADHGGRRRNARASLAGDRAGARFRFRSRAAALRAAAGRGIGARARRSAARRCRRGGRPPRASGRTRTDGPPSSGVDPSFAILHGLYWLCANLAAAGPLCLVVDDAHWADAPSLRYLAFLLTRLEELDAALVVATRPPEAGTDAELLATVTTDPSAE